MNGENQEKININLEKFKEAEKAIEKEQVKEKQVYSSQEPEKKKKGWKKIFVFLILILIIIGAFYLWKNKTNHKDSSPNEMAELIKKANEQFDEISKKRGPITSKDIEEANRLLDLVSKQQ